MIDDKISSTDAARWRAELLAFKREIIDLEPVAALDRIDCLLDELEGLKRAPPSGGCERSKGESRDMPQ